MHPDEVPILERAETVPFFWPSGGESPIKENTSAYSVEITADRTAFEKVQALAGWHVTEDQWQLLSKEVVPKSMMLVTQERKPVAVACGLSRESNWVELAWVAVAPPYRGRGLGKVVCRAVVKQLIDLDRPKIFGRTQDERLSAIKIYLDVGFYPLYRKHKIERWHSICKKLGRPFTPSLWGWPTDGLPVD